MGIEFEDNRVRVKEALFDAADAFLHEAGGEIQARTIRNSRTDSGDTKGSYEYKVSGSFMAGEQYCQIGSNLENAIWEEFGTGEYALKGNGRKGAWYVPVDTYMGSKAPTYNGKVVIVYGKGGQAFFKTNGKKPNRPMHNAFTSLKSKLIRRYKAILTDKIGR